MWSVYLEFGVSDMLGFGKHTLTFTPVKTGENSVLVYGNSTTVKPNVSATPAWATTKMKVTATQLDDTKVQVSFTNLGTDSTNGLDYYHLVWTVNGETYDADLDFEDVVKNGSTLTYTLDLKDSIVYNTPYTFTVQGYGEYYGFSNEITGKLGSVTVKKLTELWKTAPAVKTVVSSVSRLATVTVTCKGNPDNVKLQWSADAKTWTEVDFTTYELDKGYTADIDEYNTKVEITDIEGTTVTYRLTTYDYYNYTGNLYLRAIPEKGYEDDNG